MNAAYYCKLCVLCSLFYIYSFPDTAAILGDPTHTKDSPEILITSDGAIRNTVVSIPCINFPYHSTTHCFIMLLK